MKLLLVVTILSCAGILIWLIGNVLYVWLGAYSCIECDRVTFRPVHDEGDRYCRKCYEKFVKETTNE